MTWISFDNECSCQETNPCVLVFTIFPTLGEDVTAAEFETLRFGTAAKSMNVVYKTNIDCSFIWEMVEKLLHPQ